MSFGFDGRAFDPVRTDQSVALGVVEEWTITNSTPMNHPFHLHVWPFEVLADSAGTPTTGTLQDVVLVSAGGWVRLRLPFTALPGRSVDHPGPNDAEEHDTAEGSCPHVPVAEAGPSRWVNCQHHWNAVTSTRATSGAAWAGAAPAARGGRHRP